jgi:hypothetical protein
MSYDITNDQSYREFITGYTNLYENDVDILEAVTQEFGISLMELFVNARNSYWEDKKQDYTIASDALVEYLMNDIKEMITSTDALDNDYTFELVNQAQEILDKVFFE